MNIKWYPLKIKEYGILVFMATVVTTLVILQRFVVPQEYRLLVVLALMIIAILIYFNVVKPMETFRLSWTLAVIFSGIVLVVSFIIHVVIFHNLSFQILLVFLGAVVIPFICGWLYDGIFSQKRYRGW